MSGAGQRQTTRPGAAGSGSPGGLAPPAGQEGEPPVVQRAGGRGLFPGWSSARLTTVVKFFAAGLPAFVLAVPLNYVLVELLHLPRPVAYAIVIILQVCANFVLCRYWVFTRRQAGSPLREFGVFVAGILGFRVADWCVYVALVNGLGWYYLAVQLLNVVLFGALKFLFSERVLK
ncbi:MAG: GtrA family protein [Lentisphaerae bacterium]|nr:GtrA family protein [Lentisphaerota bacterium]